MFETFDFELVSPCGRYRVQLSNKFGNHVQTATQKHAANKKTMYNFINFMVDGGQDVFELLKNNWIEEDDMKSNFTKFTVVDNIIHLWFGSYSNMTGKVVSDAQITRYPRS